MTIMGSACSKCLLYAKHGAKQLYELSHLISPHQAYELGSIIVFILTWGQWSTGSFKRCIICCFCILLATWSTKKLNNKEHKLESRLPRVLHGHVPPNGTLQVTIPLGPLKLCSVIENGIFMKTLNENTKPHSNNKPGDKLLYSRAESCWDGWDASGMPGGTLLNARRNSHKECFWSKSSYFPTKALERA